MPKIANAVSRRAVVLAAHLDDGFASPAVLNGTDDGWFDALAMLVVDAICERDAATLAVALDRLTAPPVSLEPLAAGRLQMLATLAAHGENRVGYASATSLETGSPERVVLDEMLVRPGRTIDEMSAASGLGLAAAERAVLALHAGGFARSRPVGLARLWEATPRGGAG